MQSHWQFLLEIRPHRVGDSIADRLHIAPPWPGLTTHGSGNNNANVGHAHETSHDSVGDLTTLGVGCELETKSSVDDTEQHDDASVPGVQVTEETTALGTHVSHVMDDTEDGLEQEEPENDSSEKNVRDVEDLWVVSESS